MSYVYVKSTHDQLWTVGHYDPDGKWHAVSDHGKEEDAARRVHYLNGGGGEMAHLGRIADSLEDITKVLHLLHEQIRRLQ